MNKYRQGIRYLSSSNRLLKETHYDILKIPYDASISEIKNKFKKISLKLHPDMLKSQKLSIEEMNEKNNEYLKIKKSYEILSNTDKKDEYDLHLGIKRREGTSTNSFINNNKNTGSTFHFHEKFDYNDIPHFDKHKHEARNERTERRYVYNQKINQNIDIFGRDLYKRELGSNGPRKGIYREYKYQPNIRDDENEGKKMASKVIGGIVGVFLMWYVICGNYSTKKEEKKVKPLKVVESDKSEPILEEKNSVSKSGKKMNVNNTYGLSLIKEDIIKRDIEKEFKEQIAESVE